MPKPLIYLCGPIQNCTKDQAAGWRDRATELLAPEFETLDPLRDKYDPNSTEGATFREKNAPGTYEASRTAALYSDREIVLRDIEDIRQSRAILRYYEKPSEGSAHESAYANSMAKPLVLVTPVEPQHLSPWTRWHSVKILPTIDEACAYLKAFWLYPYEVL